ncbi:hypothetical protein BGZ72_003322, partial [Mortierella alpina]
MQALKRLNTPKIDIPGPTKEEIQKKAQYGDLKGIFDSLANRHISDGTADALLSRLAELANDADRKMGNMQQIRDPPRSVHPGPKSRSRTKSAYEKGRE